jgi:Tfp pilus assembly protein PilV
MTRLKPSPPTHGCAAGASSPKGRGRRSGSGLVIALVTLLVVTSIMGSILHALLMELRQTRQTMNQVQAQWLADSAVERSAAQLSRNTEYPGERWTIERPPSAIRGGERRGSVEIKVDRTGDKELAEVVVHANYPDDSRRRVSAERAISLPAKSISASDSRKETNE